MLFSQFYDGHICLPKLSCFWLTGRWFRRGKSAVSKSTFLLTKNLNFLVCWQNCHQPGTESQKLSSSQTLYPCSLHSRVSSWPDFEAVLLLFFLIHLLSSSLLLYRDMGLLSESPGEEICNWKEWSEPSRWTHIWLQLWWSQRLDWDDEGVGRRVCDWLFICSTAAVCVFTFPSFKKADLWSQQDPSKSF